MYVLHFVSVFRPTKLAILNIVNFMERAPIEWPVCGKFYPLNGPFVGSFF